jgi:lysophospholipase L1-like esterase
MHSSTSNSRTPSRRDIAVLLLACALVCAFVEVGTEFVFGRISHIEHRRETEYRHAVNMRRTQNAQSVLIAGNSLLLEGVDFPQLQQETGGEIDLRRTVVEGTFYLDWFYGLRRLFAEGSRPDAVVLVLNPVQLTSRSVGGDYTAHFLVGWNDILQFAEDTGADRNRTSSLALARLSFFYGARAEIRNWVLGRILPDFPILTHGLQSSPKGLSANTLREVAAQRLGRLRQLCQDHGAALVFVIPPSNEDMGAASVAEVAATEGIRVLVPIRPGVLPSSDYSDRFHLNSSGAAKFTTALAAGLRQALLANNDQTQTASVKKAISGPPE